MNDMNKINETRDSQAPVIYQTMENCQVFNGNITGCVFAMPGANITQHTREQEAPASKQEEDIVAQLTPMFFGNEEEAKSFLMAVQSMKPREITALVNKNVAEKKISPLRRHRDLYKVLNDCGIYPRTESNWNDQVK